MEQRLPYTYPSRCFNVVELETAPERSERTRSRFHRTVSYAATHTDELEGGGVYLGFGVGAGTHS